MSLLNEALRKNTSKGPLETSVSFIGRKAFNIKRILIISVVIIVTAVALTWALLARRTTAPAKPVAASVTPVGVEQKNSFVAGSASEKTVAAADIKTRQQAVSDNADTHNNTEKKMTGRPMLKNPDNDQALRNADNASMENQNKKIATSESGSNASKTPAKKRPDANVRSKAQDNKNSLETEATQEDSVASANKFYQKALQFHRDGRLKEAVVMYREVLKHTSSDADAAYNLSSAYIELSDFSSAYELLSSLHSSNPGSAEIQLNLAVAELGLGRPSNAIDLLNRLDSEDKNLKFSRLLHLGVAESQTGKLDEALACYKKAEEINGGVPKLLYNIAVVNDKLGKYRDAAVYYQKFLAAGSSASNDAEAVNARIKTLNNFIQTEGLGNTTVRRQN